MSNEIRKSIAEVLQGDKQLLSLLSKENTNWAVPEPNGKAHAKWSIIPADQFDYKKMQVPIVTIQMGDDTLIGQHHLVETVIYVRCYNNSQKTYVSITAALDRVRKLLNGRLIKLNDAQYIELVWQMTSSELEDKAYMLPFREARFTFQSV